jgi:hypothetical protein
VAAAYGIALALCIGALRHRGGMCGSTARAFAIMAAKAEI